MNRRYLFSAVLTSLSAPVLPASAQQSDAAATAIEQVRRHDFHPTKGGTTMDRALGKPGVASLDDADWKVRTLALRDLVKAGPAAAPSLITALSDANVHVRYLAATSLGILQITDALPALEKAARDDKEDTVRSQAAVALGQIGAEGSLAGLRALLQTEKNGDVLHQLTLAIHAIETGNHATPELASAFSSLDETKFALAKIGQPAPDFTLPDTTGKQWRLSDFRGKQNVLLVWIFADW